MLHRGITLIELLIAIAILLTIGAIVTPIMTRTLDERRFESAAERVELQLLLARSYAQRSGDPIEVRFETDSRRIVARRFLDGDETGDFSDRRQPPAQREHAQRHDFAGTFDDDDAGVIAEAWTERVLSRGIRLHDQPPQRTMASAAIRRQAAMDDAPAIEEESIRIAVFLPDGSALLARTIWLADDRDRLGRIRISTWTGTAKYERMPDITEEAPRSDDALDDEAAMMREAFEFE